MAKLQYRKLGTGEIALYKCVFDFSRVLSCLQWWSKVEVLHFRLYETESKLNDGLIKQQGLYKDHSDQFDAIIKAEGKIKHTRQDDPYRSDPFHESLPKDSHKYCKQRGKPINLWEAPMDAIVAAESYPEYDDDNLSQDDCTSEIVGLSGQEVGAPVRDRQGNKQRGQQQGH